jgi:serine/threonine-protein kinase
MEGEPEATASLEGSVAGATVLDKPAPRTSATTLEPPSSSLVARSSLAGGSANTTVASPLDALARDEVLRTRSFVFMGFGVAAFGLASIPFLPGGYYVTRIFVACVVIALGGLVYLFHRTRDPATYFRGPGATIGWLLAAAAVNSAVPYFGPYSPVPVLPLIGIYFVGLGQSRVLAFGLYAICALVEALSGGLVVAGVADPGIIRGDYLTLETQIVALLLIEMIFVAALYISRASRRVSLAALGELQEAIRAVAQREALLQEAREELRRALGSGRGRFSDQRIGPYQLGELIGRGGMGEVYEGVDTRSEQKVAVKMLAQTSLGNAEHVQRFLRELRTAVAIDSPNVVRVLDIGEEPLPHLVMERLHGRDLSSILREKRVLAPAKVVDLLQQVGDGITAAGARGVIHRDLKPQNVFLADKTWKILDFGVSRLADTGDTLTAGHLVGTPAYMAPEQARAARVDHRTDLYALAAIAYRALTGHAPFSSGDIADVLYRVVHTPPRRPTSHAQLPADLDLALAIGLAKDPADRFATAAELATAVRDALEDKLSDATRARARAIENAWAK